MEFQGKKLRHEYKYYLHAHDYMALRHKVSQVLTMDRNSLASDGYEIRSLYFDGPHRHSLHDKNDGIFKREKYRIRIYNGSDAKISVERKSKFGEYVCKESAAISRLEYDSILDGEYSFMKEKGHTLLQEFYAALNRGFRPITIVNYVREAYVYEPGNVRITFDKRLSAGINTHDLFHPDLVLEESLLLPQTILEVKYDSFLPDHIRKLVQPDNHQRSSISKYVICREVGIKHFKE
ncbi:polyphosphate polymerase domain-containing protein [Paenibacillus mendelii]|uniref:Polyphosphate polymerase domain-containing protein n=1 Tax=Paenibacillus mendelii TaxID=206163 RepID=A0ABV6JCY4_9BACL|nr:polyphosphate polymerase domain-containing protein [Paenibacillus mendelii]MCQ6562653.1 polyphosphate polymerase domain-containing protein [Paenibacillus mendelii]